MEDILYQHDPGWENWIDISLAVEVRQLNHAPKIIAVYIAPSQKT